MAFQTPITIKEALSNIQRQEYVLPAIQREFTWNTDQICGLFDSLMQGYPINSFLFWKVESENSQEYVWYGFIRNYHRKTNRHCPILDVPQKSLIAVLDGQQRLTSLNISLRGSHADKKPRKWWNNPDAFPVKYLYLNLLSLADENELGLKYDFQFLTPERAENEQNEQTLWFPVSQAYNFTEEFDVILALQNIGLGNNQQAARHLHRLYAVIHKDGVIPFFEETEQDLDKVLDIFIRVNSAGTPLKYSDILLSIATAQWRERDARQAIHGLVDELNDIRYGFWFSKDLVLKAGLMLSEIHSVAFRVTNFNASNMKTLEENWPKIERALRLAVEILADFGFSWQNLAADSVIIPVAYFLYKHEQGESFRRSVHYKHDRERLRVWVCQTLVKTGVWGSGLDTTLVAIRSAIRNSTGNEFPMDDLNAALARQGKDIRFTEEEIQDLLDSSYGDKRTFALLTLLYPSVDLRNHFHVDHVFPRSLLTSTKLRKVGLDETEISEYQEKANLLPNLQLLEGHFNQSKKDMLPSKWLAQEIADEGARARYCSLHDLVSLPSSELEFKRFFEARRESMDHRLRQVLGLRE